MDTSKEYRKMCNCSEIQDRHIHNYCTDIYYINRGVNTACPENNRYDPAQNKAIWLPLQDQLQKMIIDNYEEIGKEYNDKWERLLFTFNDFVNMGRYIELGWSMEQLWLAFVMKEKFNKTWDGKEWING